MPTERENVELVLNEVEGLNVLHVCAGYCYTNPPESACFLPRRSAMLFIRAVLLPQQVRHVQIVANRAIRRMR